MLAPGPRISISNAIPVPGSAGFVIPRIRASGFVIREALAKFSAMARVVTGDNLNAYFLTLTVVDWVDVFTRPVYRHIFTDSLNYAVDHKGMDLYAWVLMSNHAHLVAAAREGFDLSDILRDLKKHTSKKIVATIREPGESRQDWMLHRFAWAGKGDPKIKEFRFWQEGNFPKECFTPEFVQQKIHYTHYNPVRAEWVDEPHHYRYSSAIDYAGGKGLVPVTVLNL